MLFSFNKEKNDFEARIEHGDTWNFPFIVSSTPKEFKYHRLIALHSPGNMNKPNCLSCVLNQTNSCVNQCFGQCINTYFRPYEEIFGEDL